MFDPRAQGTQPSALAAPGMLRSHYAPGALLRLNTTPEPGEAFLAFGATPRFAGPTRNLSPQGDLHEAARNLFSMLHELDASEAATIAVAPRTSAVPATSRVESDRSEKNTVR